LDHKIGNREWRVQKAEHPLTTVTDLEKYERQKFKVKERRKGKRGDNGSDENGLIF